MKEKQILLISMLTMLISSFSFGQGVREGVYTSENGMYSFELEKVEGGILVKEPNRNNLYISRGPNQFFHSEEQYSDYYIRIIDNQKLATGKRNSNEMIFLFSHSKESFEDIKDLDDCPLYLKYLEKSQQGPEVQAWTFCGAAALAKCNMSKEEFEAYARTIIMGLKSMMEQNSQCPCEDVISKELWNKVNL